MQTIQRPMPKFFFAAAVAMLFVLLGLCFPATAFAVEEEWQQETGTLIDKEVVDLATDGTYVYAATDGYGVFERDAQGTWTNITSNLPNIYVLSLCHDGTNLYAGTTGSGVFSYDRASKTWAAVDDHDEPFMFTVSELLWHGSMLYAGTINAGEWLYYGIAWTKIDSTGLDGGDVWALAVYDSTLYAGTSQGVFAYEVTSWKKVSGTTVLNVTALLTVGDVMYAGTDGDGAYVFDGSSWTPIRDGFPTTTGTPWTEAKITGFAANGSTLYASLRNDAGVYVFDANTATWTAMNNKLTDLKVSSLALAGNTLFAGTAATGVFSTELSSNNPVPPPAPPADTDGSGSGLAKTGNCISAPLITAVLLALGAGILIAIGCLRRSKAI